jgi:uncharacterized membrane protein YkoI
MEEIAPDAAHNRLKPHFRPAKKSSKFKQERTVMKAYVTSVLAASSLLVGCNRSVERASQKFNELPAAVQETVRAERPNSEIANVSHKTRDGTEVYEVEFREPGKNPKIEVYADGRVLKADAAKSAGAVERPVTPTGAVGTKLSALPEAAQKTILSKAPNSQIAGILRHEKDGRVIYEIEFKEPGTNSTMQVAQDGALIQELQKKPVELPAPTAPTP